MLVDNLAVCDCGKDFEVSGGEMEAEGHLLHFHFANREKANYKYASGLVSAKES